jgi:hypothetical protein
MQAPHLEQEHAATLADLQRAASASPVDEDGILAAIDKIILIEQAMPPDVRAKYVEPLDPEQDIFF